MLLLNMQTLFFDNLKWCFLGVVLLILFSFKESDAIALRESGDTKNKSSNNDTILVNLDSIFILNFGDYFSKIEIIPLESLDIISTHSEKFDCRNPMYIAMIKDGGDCVLNIDLINEGYIIFQSELAGGRNFYFDKEGHFKRVENYLNYDKYPVSVSTPPSIVLDYKNKTILPDPFLGEKSWWGDIKILHDNHYVFPKDIYSGNRFVFIVTECMERTYFSFHDKETNYTVTGIDLFSNGLVLPGVRVMNNGILYCMVDPWYLNSAIDTVYLTEESKKRLPDIQLNDNSIIVKYYAK